MFSRKKSARRRRDASDPFTAALLNEESDVHNQNPKHDHKTMQLCAQVRDALSLSLSGECHDDLLRETYVDEVVPAPNASRLLVRLILPAHSTAKVADLYERLSVVSPFLRTLVAREISRKRTPEFTFVIVPESEVQR